VIAESFERIHRANLVGMGVLPLAFERGESIESSASPGRGVPLRRRAEGVMKGQPIHVTAIGNKTITFDVVAQVFTESQRQLIAAGGMPLQVLTRFVNATRSPMSTPPLTLDRAATALVLIDLQYGIVGQNVHPQPSDDVVARCKRLAQAFRAVGAPVVLVTVGSAGDGKDMLAPTADSPAPAAGARPANWSTVVDELDAQPTDLRIMKPPVGCVLRNRARPAAAAPRHPHHRARGHLDQRRRRVHRARRVRARL
jgi:hypothetical protein